MSKDKRVPVDAGGRTVSEPAQDPQALEEQWLKDQEAANAAADQPPPEEETDKKPAVEKPSVEPEEPFARVNLKDMSKQEIATHLLRNFGLNLDPEKFTHEQLEIKAIRAIGRPLGY